MKKNAIILAIIILCSFSYGQYFGKDFEDMSQTEKMMMYNSYKKSPALGVLYGFLLPTTGHAYSGNWKRGLLFKGAQISAFTLSLITSEIAWENGSCPSGYEQQTDDWGYQECRDENYNYAEVQPTSLNIVSMVLMASVPVLVIWEYIDIVKSVKKYNNRVYKDIFGKEPPSFSLNLQPTYQGANLTLAYKFD